MTDKAQTLPMTDQNETNEFFETVIACCNGQMGIDAAREVISELHLAGFKIVPEARTSPVSANALAALELAEDVLSRAPFSTDIWPNGVHPNTGIKQIRSAIADLRGHAQTPVLPVAWRWRHGPSGHWAYSEEKPEGPSIHLFRVEPLYAAGPDTSAVREESK